MKPHLIRYLQYVINTGGNATIDTFDDDFEPIGPIVRSEIIPEFVVVQPNRKLALTEIGRAALSGTPQ